VATGKATKCRSVRGQGKSRFSNRVLKGPFGRRIFPCNVLQESAAKPRSILDGNQFKIVGRKDLPFRVLHCQSWGFASAFVQNLETFLAAREEITFSPLTQSNDDREQLSAFLG
jgi:hypothetical protein